MARKKSSSSTNNRSERKTKDAGKKVRKKVCVFCKEHVDWVDYKDVSLLRRFMSDRAKIRARRVSGNNAQQQAEIARAIKNAREMALLPYATKVTSQRTSKGDRGDRGRADGPPPRPSGPPPSGEEAGDDVLLDDDEAAVEVEVDEEVDA